MTTSPPISPNSSPVAGNDGGKRHREEEDPFWNEALQLLTKLVTVLGLAQGRGEGVAGSHLWPSSGTLPG